MDNSLYARAFKNLNLDSDEKKKQADGDLSGRSGIESQISDVSKRSLTGLKEYRMANGLDGVFFIDSGRCTVVNKKCENNVFT